MALGTSLMYQLSLSIYKELDRHTCLNLFFKITVNLISVKQTFKKFKFYNLQRFKHTWQERTVFAFDSFKYNS